MITEDKNSELKIDTLEGLFNLVSYFQAIKTEPNELGELDIGLYNSAKRGFVFRGHKSSHWILTSSLERYLNGYGINFSSKKSFEIICDEILSEYKSIFRGRISEQYMLMSNEYDDELWAFAQHYDIKTPLLDWTYSFFVALYFAFFDRKDIKKCKCNKDEIVDNYRAVFCLNLYTSFQDKELQIFSPKTAIGGRINSQKGLFTKAVSKCYENVNDNYNKQINEMLSNIPKLDDSFYLKYYSNYFPRSERKNELDGFFMLPITKILISDKLRADVLNYLKSVNVDGFSLFSDIKGLVNECHLIVEDRAYIRKNFGG